MRVLYVDHTTKPSGGQLALQRLTSGLPSDVDWKLLAPSDGSLAAGYGDRLVEWPGAAALADATQRSVRRLRPGRVLRAALELRRAIRTHRPDVVHISSFKAIVLGALAARSTGVPLVVHVRDRYAADYMGTGPRLVAQGLAGLVPDAIVANSPATAALVWHPRRQQEVVVLPSPTAFGASRHAPVRAAGDPLRVVSASRLLRWKGIDLVIDAVDRLRGEGHDVELNVLGEAVFGDDGTERALREQVARLGLERWVHFSGFVEDVEDELLRNHVLVLATRIPEPFGQVVIEGMACGLAVVASDAGGPTTTIDDGTTGLLFPLDDLEALTDRLRDLITEPLLLRTIAENAQNAVQAYRPTPVAQSAIELYHRLIDAP